MKVHKSHYYIICVLLISTFSTFSQSPKKPSSSEIYHQLQKLNFLGSVLYVAAHPDDENTRLISYLSNDIKARTAYLSLTRGDGGQNLIGPELRELLGVIRTQELLEARKIDGGIQFFTRANDFGYSKNPKETLEIWDEQEIKSDVVAIIRKFKPDVIINRFDHRSPGSTHGHHTSSAMLSLNTFDDLNDSSQFSESAKTYGTWQPERLFFNTSWWFYGSRENFDKADKTNLVSVETGNYYTNLGYSNGEIAALSRSKHQSQGFGSTGSRGNQTEYLELLKGSLPSKKDDLFDGINTTWTRIEGGIAIGNILNAVEKDFNFKDPSSHLPQLMEAYALLEKTNDSHWKTIKTKELKELIAVSAGLFLEAVANQQTVAPKGDVTVTIEAINRSTASIKLHSISSSIISFPTTFAPTTLAYNEVYNIESVPNTFSHNSYTTPYWLENEGTMGMYKVTDQNLLGLPEREVVFPVTFNLSILGQSITFEKNIIYKYNDPVQGEIYQPFEVLPDATSTISEKVLIFSDEKPKDIPVVIKSGKTNVSGTVILQYPEGWDVFPKDQVFSIENKGATQTLIFTVTPPKEQSEGYLKPLIQVGDSYLEKELVTIDYDHISFQHILLPSQAKVVRIPIEKKGKLIGYINGAGDAIPESLKQIGYEVETIDPLGINANNLNNYDAIVLGVRAYNTILELAFKQQHLNNYVKNGGTLLAQYNTSRGLVTKDFSPLPMELSRERVTNEFSEVKLLAKNHPVLNSPNKITEKDFEGWVQERGLYFPNQWDNSFTPILEMSDAEEKPLQGSLLVSEYGKGYYIYTGLSFFRELPAGVAGAYRIFANLLSLGN